MCNYLIQMFQSSQEPASPVSPTKRLKNPLQIIIVDKLKDRNSKLYNGEAFNHLRKNSLGKNLEGLFQDDQFKLQENKQKTLVRKRLKDIFKTGSALNELSYQSPHENNIQPQYMMLSKPSYFSQIHLLPPQHFISMIEPPLINQQGFYNVALNKNGRFVKQVIDDYVYYDQKSQQIEGYPFKNGKPWMYIIIKLWAKINKGYKELSKCPPFSFIQHFSFPDWVTLNPPLESLKSLITIFDMIKKKKYFCIAKTKNHQNIGYYGLIPNCASYMILDYYQQFNLVVVKMKSLVGDKWNGKYIDKDSESIDIDKCPLNADTEKGQFLIPYQQFKGLFHHTYHTTNKYFPSKHTFYSKYTVNLDARESRAKLIAFQLIGEHNEYSVSLSFSFPFLKKYEFVIDRQDKSIPDCKILIGRQIEHVNNEASVADSLKEKFLKNQTQNQNFMTLSDLQYDYIFSDYFKGYTQNLTYILNLKPGKYILRLKAQKILVEYSLHMNIISEYESKIYDSKMNNEEGKVFIDNVLQNKARIEEQKDLTYISPNKNSWIISNSFYDKLGYIYIIFQINRAQNFKLHIRIDIKNLKQQGYKLKHKIDFSQTHHKFFVFPNDSKILVLKYDSEWKGKTRSWPPESIQIMRASHNNLPETF